MRLFILIILTTLPNLCFAADNLLINGVISDLHTKERLNEAWVEVVRDNLPMDTIYCSQRGKFDLTVELHKEYQLHVKAEGFETKWILIDTRNIAEEDIMGGFWLDLNFNLFKVRENFDNSCLSGPMGKAKFIPRIDNIDFDKVYTDSIYALLDQASLFADSLNRPQFNLLTAKGDSALEKKQVKMARDFYLQAQLLIPDDQAIREKLIALPRFLTALKTK